METRERYDSKAVSDRLFCEERCRADATDSSSWVRNPSRFGSLPRWSLRQSSHLQSLRAQRHCRIHAHSRPRWHENRNQRYQREQHWYGNER